MNAEYNFINTILNEPTEQITTHRRWDGIGTIFRKLYHNPDGYERTGELVETITGVLGRGRPDQIHPATRSFQALRIFVNDELGELARGLAAAERLLAPEGRLAVVTFHSLEDRIVKRFLAREARPPVPRGLPLRESEMPVPTLKLVGKPVRASAGEVAANPRSRSAIMRVSERTGAPWRS